MARRGVGVYPQQRCLEPAGSKLVGTGAVGRAATRLFRGAVRRRQHRSSWAGSTTTSCSARSRRGVGLHPQRRRLGPAGSKLVGTGAVGASNRALGGAVRRRQYRDCGRTEDNSGIGAAWVFTRSNGVWTQQGSKLVGTGAVGRLPKAWCRAVRRRQHRDCRRIGRRHGCRSSMGLHAAARRLDPAGQQAGRHGRGRVDQANQGYSVALSGDGNTAIVGGTPTTPKRRRVGLRPARTPISPTPTTSMATA